MTKKIKDKKINIDDQIWTVNFETYSAGKRITFYNENLKRNRFIINLISDKEQDLFPSFYNDTLLEHFIFVYCWGIQQRMNNNNNRVLEKLTSILEEEGLYVHRT